MPDTGELSTKRQRPPSQKAAPKDSVSPESWGQEFKEGLAGHEAEGDDVSVFAKRYISNFGGVASKRPARAKDELDIKGGSTGSARSRAKQVARSVDKEQYEPMHLYKDSNWVLFDPIKSFPPIFANPPKFLLRFTHYTPGNYRILEYNIGSNSIRLKRTPELLRAKSVGYTDLGPRLSDNPSPARETAMAITVSSNATRGRAAKGRTRGYFGPAGAKATQLSRTPATIEDSASDGSGRLGGAAQGSP